MFVAKRKKVRVQDVSVGRVYVFKFELEDTVVYKVGMCHSDRTVDRFMEVLRSYFQVYRYVPKASILKFKEFDNPLLVEQHLHKELKEYAYRFPKKFDGSTEFFSEIDIDYLLDYISEFTYDILLDCTTMDEEDYKAVHKVLGKDVSKDVSKIPF